MNWYQRDIDQVLADLNTSERGLTDAEVRERLEKFGPNTLAEAEKINRAYVCRLLNLTLLAPDIQDAILKGRQAKGMMLEQLMGSMSSVWDEQCERFAHP